MRQGYRKMVADRESGTVTLAEGATDGSVSESWGGTPTRIWLTVEAPEGGDIIYANLVADSQDANGFDFQLSAATPTEGYKLHFICNF